MWLGWGWGVECDWSWLEGGVALALKMRLG